MRRNFYPLIFDRIQLLSLLNGKECDKLSDPAKEMNKEIYIIEKSSGLKNMMIK